MNSFSVLILTYNEETNIADCVQSVSLSNDIVILDSFSKDKTERISESLNIRFYKKEFVDYSDQRNYGLHEIEFKNEYVLILDADERLTKDLSEEIFKICNKKEGKLDVYLLRRRVVLENKILKWNYSSSFWIERLVRPKKVKFQGNVHEKLIYKGENGFLKGYILHYQFSKGIDHWIMRRKKYAHLEAISHEENLDIINDNIISKRIKMKKFFVTKVPFFYYIYFIYNFFIKFAFLDGYKGLKYITLETYSLYLISKHKNNGK
ncbi:Glycosyltransferase involved in cell wall bisynthesis [Chryseobacterium oranimense]|uniref:Glycosyltransferase involved in cell wall bisynthesis n=1 Tax=Chryseobacterium oranimense TaxID=421058 RepID=A0A1M5VJV7_9FLAO|nr:glycosyltransferase family 2 protein [Chryseobacterium oranimense]SHH75478.1 Glycosyltransferase involved in cell wall bisynthesis [Chryseobacterium oranimense]